MQSNDVVYVIINFVFLLGIYDLLGSVCHNDEYFSIRFLFWLRTYTLVGSTLYDVM